MYKCVLCAFLLFSGMTQVMAAAPSSATSAITVTILKALSITKTQDLNFATLSAGTTAGTATVDPTTGAVSTTGGTLPVGTGSTYASFQTIGQAGYTLSIYYTGALPTLTRSGGAQTMKVTALTINTASTSWPITVTGPINFNIGAVMNVAANQTPGNYSGTFTIQVVYQ